MVTTGRTTRERCLLAGFRIRSGRRSSMTPFSKGSSPFHLRLPPPTSPPSLFQRHFVLNTWSSISPRHFIGKTQVSRRVVPPHHRSSPAKSLLFFLPSLPWSCLVVPCCPTSFVSTARASQKERGRSALTVLFSLPRDPWAFIGSGVGRRESVAWGILQVDALLPLHLFPFVSVSFSSALLASVDGDVESPSSLCLVFFLPFAGCIIVSSP